MSIPVSRKVVTTLVRKATQMTESVNEVVKQHGLTIQQFNVLRILRGRDGQPANLHHITKQMIHSNSNTTRVIDKLVTKKLAERVQCPADRRQVEISITAAGLTLLKKIDSPIDDRETLITSNLTEADKSTLLELLNKL